MCVCGGVGGAVARGGRVQPPTGHTHTRVPTHPTRTSHTPRLCEAVLHLAQQDFRRPRRQPPAQRRVWRLHVGGVHSVPQPHCPPGAHVGWAGRSSGECVRREAHGARACARTRPSSTPHPPTTPWQDASLVLVEFGVNDRYEHQFDYFDNLRQGLERMFRKLLELPGRWVGGCLLLCLSAEGCAWGLQCIRVQPQAARAAWEVRWGLRMFVRGAACLGSALLLSHACKDAHAPARAHGQHLAPPRAQARGCGGSELGLVHLRARARQAGLLLDERQWAHQHVCRVRAQGGWGCRVGVGVGGGLP